MTTMNMEYKSANVCRCAYVCCISNDAETLIAENTDVEHWAIIADCQVYT